jgi:hypothetical protein
MGSKLGMMPVVYTQTSSPTTQTVLNVQGSGRLRSIILSTVGLGTAINTARVSIVIDSTTTEDIYINTTTTNLAAVVRSGVFGTASSMFASSLTSANDGTATAQSTYNLDAYFKNQLKVHFRSVGSVACDIFVGYETTS